MLCKNRLRQGLKYFVRISAPLAGFEVFAYRRFSGVHRGWNGSTLAYAPCLNEAPEVPAALRMNLAANGLHGAIQHFVLEFIQDFYY